MVISFLWHSWDNLLSTQVFSQINAEPCVLPGLQLPDNFLDTFIVSYDFLTFVACWKQISADFRFHVPAWARIWLSPSICQLTESLEKPKPGRQDSGIWRFLAWRFHQSRKMAQGVVLSTKWSVFVFFIPDMMLQAGQSQCKCWIVCNTHRTICSKTDFAAIKKVYRLWLFLSWWHFNSSFPSHFTDSVGFFSLVYPSPEGNYCFEEEQIFFMIFFSNAKSNSPLGKASNGKLWPAQIKGDPIYSGRILWELQMKTAI